MGKKDGGKSLMVVMENGLRLLHQMRMAGDTVDPVVEDAMRAALCAMYLVQAGDFDPKKSLGRNAHPTLDFRRTRAGYIEWIDDQFDAWVSNGYPKHAAFDALDNLARSILITSQEQSDGWSNLIYVALPGISIEMSERKKARVNIASLVQGTIKCVECALINPRAPLLFFRPRR